MYVRGQTRGKQMLIKQVLIKTIRAVKPTKALNQQATPEGEVTVGTLKLPSKISGAPLQ